MFLKYAGSIFMIFYKMRKKENSIGLKRQSRKAFTFMEVLLAIIIVSVFASSALIVFAKSNGTPLMMYYRTQALNLARARINELFVVPDAIKLSYNNIIDNEAALGYQFKRKTEVTFNGSNYHFKVTVTNGTFNDDGTMGNDLVLEADK